LLPVTQTLGAHRSVQAFAEESGPLTIHVDAVCPGFVETEMFSVLDEGFGKYLGKTPEQNRGGSIVLAPLGRKDGKPER